MHPLFCHDLGSSEGQGGAGGGVLVVVVVVLGVLKRAPAPAPCITPAIALPCPFEQIDWALDGF